MLVVLSAITAEQVAATLETTERVKVFLDYVATHPDIILTFKKSNMVLSVHSNVSYLTEPKTRSQAGGYFFMSDNSPN